MGTFASRIKELRIRKEMTQDQLASMLKVSRSTVGMYETGSREPDFETLENIADIFNVNMDYLTGRSDDEHGSVYVNNDPELTKYLEELKNRKEMRMLFSLAAGATKEDVERTVKIVEAALGKQAKDE